jgi:K+-transporting ATPase KdpF subunit
MQSIEILALAGITGALFLYLLAAVIRPEKF